MNEQGARGLAAKIGRTLGCKATANYDHKCFAWVVTTPDGTYSSPFEWHYQQAQLTSALRKMKRMRRRVAFG